MHIGLIVNPVAGGGRALRLLPSICDALRRSGHRSQVAVTERPGAGIEHAAGISGSDIDALIAVGGDGTLNETLNGLIRSGLRVPLGFIPAGRGSDAARSFPPLQLGSLSGALGPVESHLVDVGWIEWESGKRRYYLNVAGLGFDAAVARRANRSHLAGSTAPYLTATARELTTLHSTQLQLRSSSNLRTGEMLSVVFANGRYFGGGMKIAPHAEVDDGLLDAIGIAKMSRGELLRSFARVYRGTHLTHPAVSACRGDVFEVVAAGPAPAHVDGEYAGNELVRVGLYPKALRWMSPA